MMRFSIVIVFLFLFSCNVFDTGEEYTFLYDFENKDKISQSEKLSTVEVLKKRLQNTGIINPQAALNNSNKIELKFKSRIEVDRLNKITLNPGKLEFWEMYEGEELLDFLFDADAAIKKEIDKTEESEHPLLDLFTGTGYSGGPIISYVRTADTAKVGRYLKKKNVRSLIPYDYKYVKFLWGIDENTEQHPLYAIKSNNEGLAPIQANHITEAYQIYDMAGKPAISLDMNDEGALKWERITGNAFRDRTCIAVTLNDEVYSAPGVVAGAIKGGRTQITGNFTLNQAQDLAIILSSGQKIHKLKLLSSTVATKK